MKTFRFFILFLLASQCLSAQSIASKDEELVKQLLIDSFEEVWSNLDTSKVKVYHTDDFLLLEHGEVWNNDTIKNYQLRALKTKNSTRKNKLDFFRVERIQNSIWVAYHNYATWTKDGKVVARAYWLESAVAIKNGGVWKLQMLHSTRGEKEHH